ncbi:flavoprotein-like protein [Paraphoma chrysanthemicola]|uniref:Flavoprotein-like protein n=1 Tax=Paraphoma chrysanthemicola TaxID=798071 RepID=A0A8K0RKY1_9PLEO|nr:flavoprotein-like protein [Paraphoma chrysanthemicola]
MHILGLCNGSIGGNSEVLLKAALTSATAGSSTITTSWLHIPSIVFPRNAGPLKNSADISAGTNASNNHNGTDTSSERDDRPQVLNAILEADALVFSTAVYSHQPAGTLKALLDNVLGPYTDAALATRILSTDKDSRYAGMSIDARILKPRVAAFLAVGGSTTPDQFTMVLPTLHLFCYSLHVKVVDQVVCMGYANPGAVLKSSGDEVMLRAEELGRNVASQIGKSFDDALYLGPEPEGACPACHLAKYDFFGGSENNIGCVTCGNTGKLVAREGGKVGPVWDTESEYCCISMKGKQKHVDDIFKKGSSEWKSGVRDAAFEERLKEWRGRECGRVELR